MPAHRDLGYGLARHTVGLEINLRSHGWITYPNRNGCGLARGTKPQTLQERLVRSHAVLRYSLPFLASSRTPIRHPGRQIPQSMLLKTIILLAALDSLKTRAGRVRCLRGLLSAWYGQLRGNVWRLCSLEIHANWRVKPILQGSVCPVI